MSCTRQTFSIPAALFACALLLAACGKAPDSQTTAVTPESPAPETSQADAERDAQLASKEHELAQREAELKLEQRELEIAKREAELAAQARKSEPKKAAPKPVVNKLAANKPEAAVDAPKPVMPARPVPLTVPSGTSLTVSLSSELSTRTARQGDPFEARTVSDILVDGKVAVPANTRVTGSVAGVISGSNKIGGVPTLGLRFDSLVLPDGQRIAIDGTLDEQGKSDTGRDSAKIIGGAAAGAIIGHQVQNNDGGKIIGGLLGGVLGAVAARKTGTEVQLAAGSTLTIALTSPFEVIPQ